MKITDEEIKRLAEEYASDRVPDPRVVMSQNKWDLRAGFVAGAKKIRELLENSSLQRPDLQKNRFDY